MIAIFFALALGKAAGAMVVSGKATPLRHAYAVETNTLIRIIVSAEPIEDPAHADDFTGVAVQLDEKKKAEEVFFFHPKLPAGLSVSRSLGLRWTLWAMSPPAAARMDLVLR